MFLVIFWSTPRLAVNCAASPTLASFKYNVPVPIDCWLSSNNSAEKSLVYLQSPIDNIPLNLVALDNLYLPSNSIPLCTTSISLNCAKPSTPCWLDKLLVTNLLPHTVEYALMLNDTSEPMNPYPNSKEVISSFCKSGLISLA